MGRNVQHLVMRRNDIPKSQTLGTVKTISPAALSDSVSDIGLVISMIDRIVGSTPDSEQLCYGYCYLILISYQLSGSYINFVSSAGSVNDSFKQFSVDISDLDSTASSAIKRPQVE
ncbi:hypothetical protein Tco_0808586, partial [Tanacetum coccineum]